MANLKHQGFPQVAHNDIFQVPCYLMIYTASALPAEPSHPLWPWAPFINTTSSHHRLHLRGIEHCFLPGPEESKFRDGKKCLVADPMCYLFRSERELLHTGLGRLWKALIKSLCWMERPWNCLNTLRPLWVELNSQQGPASPSGLFLKIFTQGPA